MIRLLPPVGDEIDGPLTAVLQAAVAEGAPVPSWVAVEDEQGEWVRHAAAAGAADRARAVVALKSEAALVAAVRLGIGGAMSLPPSTQGAAAALHAAEATVASQVSSDSWLADLAAGWDGDLVAVTWVDRPFWRCQFGEPFMAALLAELAGELGVLPALLPWPALLLSPRPAEEIHQAWEIVTARANRPTQGVEVVACGPREGHCGVVTTAMRSLVDHVSGAVGLERTRFPRPVYRLPSGQLEGWWAPTEAEAPTPNRGWLASPHSVSEAGFRWSMEGGGGQTRWADDVLEIGHAEDVARLPGWIALGVGAGRPAGLLVQRMAAVAERTGVRLWVPNVDAGALQFLLRLPDVLWVDGPAVPEPPPADT